MNPTAQARVPLVSVIVNCRNGAEFVRAALASICEQTMDDLEVVFWDNVSTDGSLDVAKEIDPRVRCFRGEAPLSLGAARGRAVREARGRYLAFLDIDDTWVPTKLEKQLALFDDRPELGLAYSDMTRVDEQGRHLCRWSAERKMRRGRVLPHLLEGCFIAISTIVVPAAMLKAVGGFDPRFMQVEDWDLYGKIASRYEVDYIDEPLVQERVHTSNLSHAYDQVAEESMTLLQEWGRQWPQHAAVCTRMLAVAEFKRAGVRAYRHMRRREVLRCLREMGRCAAVVGRHPVFVPRVLMRFANRDNRRSFVARYSNDGPGNRG